MNVGTLLKLFNDFSEWLSCVFFVYFYYYSGVHGAFEEAERVKSSLRWMFPVISNTEYGNYSSYLCNVQYFMYVQLSTIISTEFIYFDLWNILVLVNWIHRKLPISNNDFHSNTWETFEVSKLRVGVGVRRNCIVFHSYICP